MEKILRGVHAFQTEHFGKHEALFAQLAKGQSPETLFITCSDSRIDPNLLTQTEPGELFVIRNAGNLIPPYGASNGGEGATVEYAVAALGVKHIIVCGHSHCGAMAGLLKPEAVAELPAVSAWLKQAEATRRIVNENHPDAEGDERLKVAIKENVLVQIENLRTHPAVAAKLARGQLKLHAWVYEFESGTVYNYEPEAGKFEPLGDEARREAARL